MTAQTPDTIAAALWTEWHKGRHMPKEWMGRLSMDEAYRVQLALLDRFAAAGEPQAGWKVGLTAAAMRAQWNIHEPCFGFLLRSGHKQAGHRFRFPGIIAPGFENELCLRIGTRLQGPGVTLDQAIAAVSHAAPALEIVEKRGPLSEDLALAIADNAQQYAFVTGAEIALTSSNRNLATAMVEVDVNAAVILSHSCPCARVAHFTRRSGQSATLPGRMRARNATEVPRAAWSNLATPTDTKASPNSRPTAQ